jgi:uncharacterized membrane protein YbaN (DUF454 family)
MSKILYRVLAVTAVGAGAVGVVLPLVPTTPFLLVALWASARGAPEWHARIRHHPRFEPTLSAWESERAIPRRAKLTGCLLMLVSWHLMLAMGTHPYVLIALAVLFAIGAGFLLSRPGPSIERQ